MTEREGSAAALWVVMARAYRAMAAYVERSIAALGIGLSDFMILEALLHKGAMTMTELCQSALLANASMTAAIDRLEERGLVTRANDASDRRVRRVQLTREGRALIVRIFAEHQRDLEEVMKDVPVELRAEMRRGLKLIGLAAEGRS